MIRFKNERLHRSRPRGACCWIQCKGMPLDKVIGSIKAGVGDACSYALIMGFGAMLGKMLADCGGAQRIATTLIAKFGKNTSSGRWY